MTWTTVEITGGRAVTITNPEDAADAVTVTGPATTLELAGTGLQGPAGPAGATGPQGPAGPQGPPGGGGESDQQIVAFAAPANPWLATHSIPITPHIIALDSSGDPIEGDVSYPTPTQVRVDWAAPMAGTLIITS